MLWLLLCYFSGIAATPVKVCVPESLFSSCMQMEQDLPQTFECIKAPDILRCLKKVNSGEADVTNVDPAGLYLGGKYYDLKPILTELVDGESFRYQGIALVRKDSDILSPSDLRDRSSCHTGYARTVGWKIPVGRLLSSGVMSSDCDRGDLAAVRNFFNGSCVPGAWSKDPTLDSTLKREFESLCSKCKNPSTCASDDEYAGYSGVMKCLSDRAGEVAFTKVHALREYLKDHPQFEEEAEILCFEGGRQSVRTEQPCVWGHRYTNAFVARTDAAEADMIVSAFLDTQSRYSVPQSRFPDWYFKSFLSHPNGTGIRRTEDSRNTYATYLGDFLHSIRFYRHGCESGRKEDDVTLCVTTDSEHSECVDFSRASEAQGLWPQVSCAQTVSKAACMQAAQEDQAQLLVLDGGDVYKAGRYNGLQPIASELYNGSDATYYAVAVLKSASDVKNLTQLRGLRSCHTGMGRTAGWVMPVGTLVSQGLLASSDGSCSHSAGVADFFSAGSCVPGANDSKSNPGRVRSEDLCRHCAGDTLGQNKCARDSAERYSGYAGAFRCLAEGSGDVAFVKHLTVPDYTDGGNRKDWNKDMISSDFKLLCADGGTAPVSEYERCHLGKVPSHQVVTSETIGETRRLNLAVLLADVSKKFSNSSIFYKLFGPSKILERIDSDLIFKDSATGLKILPLDSTYEEVLGKKFLEASRAVDPKNCI